MQKMILALVTVLAAIMLAASYGAAEKNNADADAKATDNEKVVKTDAEWREILTDKQYYVTRKKGTERPFTGQYDKFTGDGTYVCVCCANELFGSSAKYDSGTGWPSFWRPLTGVAITEVPDNTSGMTRVEIVCSRCDAHLGHVFTDGPNPSGLRYCINSVSLHFVSKDQMEAAKSKEKAD